MKKACLLLCCNLLVLLLSAQCFQLGGDIDGEAAGDQSGHSVSLSSDGTRVAIGAPYNDGNGSNSGHVRVYDYNGTNWVQAGGDINGEATNDQLGNTNSVALSGDGNRLAIGAPANDSGGTNRGHVRVYQWNGSAWVLMGSEIVGPANGDQAGASLSITANGSRVAIGLPYRDVGGTNYGEVRVYDWNGTAWTLSGTLNGAHISELFGLGVSISAVGTRIAVGAPYNDVYATDAGQVRVFDYNGSTWNQVGASINGESGNDFSGRSVSLSDDGSRLAIGVKDNDPNGSGSGHVRVFELVAGTWAQVGADLDGDFAYDYFGTDVSLSADGTRVAVGVPGYDGANGSNSGRIRVYEERLGVWLPVCLNMTSTDLLDGEATFDNFGRSVSLSNTGEIVAGGADGNDGNGASAGNVRVFGELVLLPIRLIYFTATALSGTNVKLDWQTGSETNNDHFTVQRSVTGAEWESIEQIDGAGTSFGLLSYATIDPNGHYGTSYYRLMQTDFDGSTTYSGMVAVIITGSNKPVVYPNPTTGRVTVKAGKGGLEGSIILDQLGKDITSTVVRYPGTSDDGMVIDLSALPSGVYYFRSAGMSQQIIKL